MGGITFLRMAVGVHLHEEVEVVVFVGEVIVHLAADELFEGVFAVGWLEGLHLCFGLFGLLCWNFVGFGLGLGLEASDLLLGCEELVEL